MRSRYIRNKSTSNLSWVREAYATAADKLAVACPSCLTIFTDAAKTEDVDSKLAVKDISQIVKESL